MDPGTLPRCQWESKKNAYKPEVEELKNQKGHPGVVTSNNIKKNLQALDSCGGTSQSFSGGSTAYDLPEQNGTHVWFSNVVELASFRSRSKLRGFGVGSRSAFTCKVMLLACCWLFCRVQRSRFLLLCLHPMYVICTPANFCPHTLPTQYAHHTTRLGMKCINYSPLDRILGGQPTSTHAIVTSGAKSPGSMINKHNKKPVDLTGPALLAQTHRNLYTQENQQHSCNIQVPAQLLKLVLQISSVLSSFFLISSLCSSLPDFVSLTSFLPLLVFPNQCHSRKAIATKQSAE